MRWLLLLVVAGCRGYYDDSDTAAPTDIDTTDPAAPWDLDGPWGAGLLDPFPHAELMDDEGFVAIPADALPPTETSLPVRDLAWRRGFSPVQVSVTTLPGVDPAMLPDWRTPTPGTGGVQLYDLTAGVPWPVMAEVDQHEDATPSLLVRPLTALPDGHRVAVVVTTEAAPRPTGFAEATLRHAPTVDLIDELAALGVASDAVALAWSFPVDAGRAPLSSALEQRTPLVDPTLEVEHDDTLNGAWTVAHGSFATTTFLDDDRHLALQADGTVVPRGETRTDLVVHVPSSVADADAGTVPVLVVGHGIFGSPRSTLDPDHPTLLHRMAHDEGLILVGTRWRGIDERDAFDAISVAGDFGTLPLITDRLVQGQVDTRVLVDWLRSGSAVGVEALQGRQGQDLVDARHVRFHGTSMGAILGGVLLAEGAPIDAATLHVGGSSWSTTLTRSRNWIPFGLAMERNHDDSSDRELLYAISQLWFDAVEPAARPAPSMPLLLQVSIGDDAVHNIGSEVLGRTWGMVQLEPTVRDVWGLARTRDTEPRVLVQLDPGTELPPEGNLPSPTTDAHDITFRWLETRMQLTAALGHPREVIHPCGSEPCSPENTVEE